MEETSIRVENTPVPIIWPILRKITVNQLMSYPSGESRSTGAPEASWYDGWESFPAVSFVNSRFPSRTTVSIDSACCVPRYCRPDFVASCQNEAKPILLLVLMSSLAAWRRYKVQGTVYIYALPVIPDFAAHGPLVLSLHRKTSYLVSVQRHERWLKPPITHRILQIELPIREAKLEAYTCFEGKRSYRDFWLITLRWSYRFGCL